MEDSQIIELYWQKNADAISETSSKYGAYEKTPGAGPAGRRVRRFLMGFSLRI